MIGARLKQARLLAGMTQRELARELGETGFNISAAAISKYEKEKSFPTARFWLTASNVLGVPITYLMHQPSRPVEWIGFRCRARLSETARKLIKAYAADRADAQSELRDLLYPETDYDFPSIPVSSLKDAECAAEQLREIWNVGDRPLDNLVQLAEDREVIVINWADKTGLFDGLSGWCADRPVTVVNSQFPLDRRRITLAHEIGHLVMDTSISADDDEALAFRFAAALLAPADHVFRELPDKSYYLNWDELKLLKRKYGLSMSAWVRRAYDLNMISYSTYKAMNIEYKSLGWHKGEPVQYIGDEEPLLLKQMAGRAIAEGLIAPDKFSHLQLSDADSDEDYLPRGDYPSASDLLEMDQEDRQRWIGQMFRWAEDVDFEVFEAYGEEEF
ncbi:MAG: XRE family transcriptional regulator [Chloroflexi bacterium]|nr:XRE family transcriptional regulator [Chloroflexota bacterium]